MKRPLTGTALRAVLALLLVLVPMRASTLDTTFAQTPVVQFPATGKQLRGKFLEYWNSHGGLAQQGYPISDEFQEVSPTDGKTYTVQYFERAVFELHPENAAPNDVLLSLLGVSSYKQRYPQGAPGQVPNTSPGSVSFPETGHRLGGRFLEYWQTHGGLAQQGYPISDEFREVSAVDGKEYTVQYFERAVFEAHPENQPPYDVLLSLLGAIQYKQRYVGRTPEPGPTPAPPRNEDNPGGDWPMYGHDAQHTSYNPDETLIGAANVEQLVSRWQVFLGSNGNPSSSSPSVAGGRVYVGSSVASGPNFFAFDAKTGAPAWSANLGYKSDCEDVGIGSTAAISGTVLAVGGGDEAYYGLDARTGARLWREEMSAGGSAFAWVSPLLAAGRAYVGVASYCDNPPVRGELRAVDLLSGEVVARKYIVDSGAAGGGIWNSPAISPRGNVLAITTGEDTHGYNGPYNRAMLTLDPLSLDITGDDQQGLTSGDFDFASSPVIFHDRNNRLLVGASHKDNHFYAYELENVNKGAIWSKPAVYAIGMLAAYDPTAGEGGTLFLTGREGLLYAVDPATGADVRPPMEVGQLHGNLAIANGLIFADAGDEGLSIYSVADGRRLRTLMPANAAQGYSGVAVSRGFIYWVSGGYLNAWSLP
ncbi:MAG TPA: PQQ-binding-like beta-propeller repeat protein [Chloroflexia bacterium]|jgi:outer membrane protein assembly factor BamB